MRTTRCLIEEERTVSMRIWCERPARAVVRGSSVMARSRLLQPFDCVARVFPVHTHALQLIHMFIHMHLRSQMWCNPCRNYRCG